MVLTACSFVLDSEGDVSQGIQQRFDMGDTIPVIEGSVGESSFHGFHIGETFCIAISN